MKIARSKTGIHVCQCKYTLDILSEAGLLGSKLASVHKKKRRKLTKDAGQPLSDPAAYRRLVGKLIYLTNTWPDIS